MTKPMGDSEFARAVREHAGMALRIAYQNLGSREDAEDVVQEAFVRLLAAPPFEGDAHRKAWLIRVTINLCKDAQKAARVRRSEPLAEEWTPASGGDGALAPDERQAVLDEVFRLPAHYRNVIYLYYYEGYTTPEIARLLGLKEKTVGTQLIRARKQLKDMLIEGGYADAQ